jgi:signal transduction histidine kinase/ActR/RegA family two-component response regulator
MTALFGALLGAGVGWRAGAAWIVARLFTEAWIWSASRPLRAGPSVGRRLEQLAVMVIGSAVWTAMPVLYWMSGVRAYELVAVALLASLLILAQSSSFRSLLATIAFGATPALALIALPLFTGRFEGVQLLSVAGGILLPLAYMVIDVRLNVANATALRQARADLLERQAELEEQTERAQAANRAKTSFLAMMSHELRTPMNGVLGMARALTNTRLNAQQASHVDMLIRSGGGLMTILNDILDISKIEAGRLDLETVAFDLHDLTARVRDLWSEAASAKGVSLIYDLDPTTPQWVAGDPTRLRQVIVNLVSNALKFTGEGEVRLAIRPLSMTASAAAVEICVSDTGIGMTPDEQAKLFQAFSQADASTTRKFGGTGLGLAICRQLVSLMGGEIGLESQPCEGSTFKVTLELMLAEPQVAQAIEEIDLAIDGLRVLVADDNAINQAVARAVLEAVGAVVLTVADGAEALEQLRGETVDVVLMDVHMPRMGGVEALSRLRAGEAGPWSTPVIALTADAMSGVDTELLSLGFDAVEPKPINPTELVRSILRVTAPQTPRATSAA